MYDAAVRAIHATDEAVGIIYDACVKHNYILLITADHGNAEQMRNAETGAPHTAHTTNAVPFVMSGDGPEGKLRFEDEEGTGKMGYLHPAKEGEGKDAKEETKEGEEAEEEQEKGALCDVAPTVLDVMGIPKPKEMTGRSLLKH